MITDSMSNAADDMQARMVKEQQVDAARVIESVQAALKADSHLVNEAELKPIEDAIQALATVSLTSDKKAIEEAITALDDSTAIFAERRMDSSINKALSGQSVDKI